MYGNIDARSEDDAGVSPTIPAATVVLLRDGEQGVEVLMLRKNSKITFGGMWVFP
ncbi:MAG TPA: NUDIX domain-containing protein, partial [Gammaproteobacteria bacterium]|nr:NUDIX domain-containing protein [Gammaproteobacteria bacterium]